MKILIILGTVRTGRISERVAAWIAQEAKQMDWETEVIDLATYELPHFNEAVSPRFNPSRTPEAAVARWLAKVDGADGYVVVTPEYNHSIPGVLKDALDHLDFQLQKKPVAIVSHGVVGGSRAAEHLKGVLLEVKAAVVPEALAVTKPDAFLNEAGQIVDQAMAQTPISQLSSMLRELDWWAQTLKNGRTQR